MAQSLNSYYWAKDPLNEEVPYDSDHIIVEDSDVDGSIRAKTERNRRREAIGQRYLLGHVPLIQTASSRGPFGSKSGWFPPWGHVRDSLKNKRPSRSTENHIEDTNAHEAKNTEKDTFTVEKPSEASIEEISLDRHMDDDAVRYDADNEDDAFEDVNDEGRNLLYVLQRSDDTRTRHTNLSRGELQPRNSDNDISEALEKDFQPRIKRDGSGDSMTAGTDVSHNERKRKVDTGWLRGMNVLKRSRYELFEHSSPTPVASALREGNRGPQLRSFQQNSDPERSDGQEDSQILSMSDSCNPIAQFKATNKTSKLGKQDEISFDAMKDSTKAFLMPNGQIVAAGYEGLICSYLGQHNVNGLRDVSHHEHVLTGSPGKWQVDVVQLSPSELDVEDSRSSGSDRRLSRPLRSMSLEGDSKVSDEIFHGLLPVSACITDEHIVPPYLDGKADFRDIPSPASGESFCYRKTRRKSQERTITPNLEKGEEKLGALGKAIPERHGRAPQQTDVYSLHSSGLMSSGNSRGSEIQGNTSCDCIKKDGEHRHQSQSPVGKLDGLNELDTISSPDPLSEDFQDSHRQQFTQDMDQGLQQNTASSSPANIVAAACQRALVTHISQASHQQASGIQQYVLGGSLQLSTSDISKDHMNISINVKDSPLQDQLSGASAKQLELAAKAEDMDKTTPAQRYNLNGRIPSQVESLEVTKTPRRLSHGLQQPDGLAVHQVNFKGPTEPSQTLDLDLQIGSSSESTSIHVDTQVLEELARSTQSSWAAVRIEPLRPSLSSRPGSNSSLSRLDTSFKSRHLRVLPTDETEFATLSAKVEDQSTMYGENRDNRDSLEPFNTLFKHSKQFSYEPRQSPLGFPSTQTLVDAATTNPWNSAFKKPGRRKPEKQVSFGPFPSEVTEAARDTLTKPPERLGSPPPPAGTLRLTQLDDPFHHRLKATRDLEITEESLTKFMNTPWDDIPATRPRVKPFLSSPAVAAMAEAFIAADKESIPEKAEIKDGATCTRKKLTEFFIKPRTWAASEVAELRSSSPLDASFSIAPNGMVTAVSIEGPVYDAEDNLHAVIEDMGSFLEGWDVESELKKAKGHKFEKGNDLKAPRRRECLSGISNR